MQYIGVLDNCNLFSMVFIKNDKNTRKNKEKRAQTMVTSEMRLLIMITLN